MTPPAVRPDGMAWGARPASPRSAASGPDSTIPPAPASCTGWSARAPEADEPAGGATPPDPPAVDTKPTGSIPLTAAIRPSTRPPPDADAGFQSPGSPGTAALIPGKDRRPPV